MVIDGSYTCGKHSIIHRVELLCCTPETDVILCVHYTQKIFLKKKLSKFQKG